MKKNNFNRWLRWCIPAFLLVIGSATMALEKPTPEELEALKANPTEFARLMESAVRLGNHKVAPELAKRTAQKLKLLAEGGDISMLPPLAWRGMPTKGTNNVLVFLIDFPGTPHVNSAELISSKLFGDGDIKDFPLESLARFYDRSSYGLLKLQGVTLGWYTMEHERDWYTDTWGDGADANYAIIKEVAEHFDGTIDYKQFDNNDDGAIDYFAVLWAGAAGPWASFWWGYQSSLSHILDLDGVQFTTYSWQWESRPVSSEFTPGVVIHETGHALGLPDYYDYSGWWGISGGVGGMDMMDAANVDHNCFSKFMLDWISPTVITTMAKQLPLQPSAFAPEAVAMAKNYTGDTAYAEYFMIQNRQKNADGNDANLPGSGLVIWHIDSRLDAWGENFLYDNSYTDHKLLRLMEADGLEQIEKGGSANAGDFYVAGKTFNNKTKPNNFFYDGTGSEVKVWDISSGPVIKANYGLMEDFVIPNEMLISGGEPFVGPYLASNKTYRVFNPLTNDIAWTVSSQGALWLKIAPAAFVAPSGSVTEVVVSIDQDVARTLQPGTYLETVTFTNNVGVGDCKRNVFLKIGKNYTLQAVDYSWIDPFDGLHPTVVMYDGVSGVINLPFPITLYGASFSNLYVSAHGLMGSDPEGLAAVTNSNFPDNSMTKGVICPLWDDVNGDQLPAKMFYKGFGERPNRKVVVTWIGASHAEDSTARFSFQAVIMETTNTITRENDIIFQYKDVAESNATYGSGQSATIGIAAEYGSIFRKYSYNGEQWLANDTALKFTQFPTIDTNPPVGRIRSMGGSGATAQFEVKFNEPVTGFAIDDLVTNSTISGITLDAIRGAGMRYEVVAGNIASLGRISMGVRAGAVGDWGMPVANSNAAFGPAVYVVPIKSTNFVDDLENGIANWTTSTNVYDLSTSVAWEWGAPAYWDGPLAAASGSHCWGTVLTGEYPSGMNAWVMSAPIEVGANPVLEFKEWHDFPVSYSYEPGYNTNMYVLVTNYLDLGYVEVDGGMGWENVTPGGSYKGDGRSWNSQKINLDDSRFGSRSIRIRFRAFSDFSENKAGLYFDDVMLHSQRAPGVWVLDYSPKSAVPGATVPVSFTVYNSSTNALVQVQGDVSSPYSGVDVVTSSVPVVYGDMAEGDIRTGAVPAQIALAASGNFTTPNVQLIHQSRTMATALSATPLPFTLIGVTALVTSNRFTATSGTGATNWLGRYLQGNGGLTSCLFQVIAAGSNGIPDLPSLTGQVSGDDRILYAEVGALPWGRFGEGTMIPPDYGRFLKSFSHGEAAGTKVYVRAWDASSFEGSVAYGDSALYPLSSAVSQTYDFGTWAVASPLPSGRDRDGDGILDIYCVTNNMDPRVAIAPLVSSWSLAQAALGSVGTGSAQFSGSVPSPTRLFYKGDYLFVLDTGNNRIQIWNRLTRQYMGAYGAQGSGNGAFNRPVGLALDPSTNRFAVADQGNFRIQVFSFDPLVPTNITFKFSFGSAQLEKPTDVAIDSSGRFFVADQRVTTVDTSVVQIFSSAGSDLGTLATAGSTPGHVRNPGGVCVGPDGMIIVADTENNRVQAFNAGGTLIWPTNGVNAVSFFKPRGVQVGLGGRVYVADTDSSQIKILRKDGSYIATLGSQNAGFSLVMNHPYGVMPVVDSNIVCVADTYNNRVLTIAPIYDGDGDGMDDIWEELHGLDSSNPNDALLDSFGLGLSNIGVYRLGLSPMALPPVFPVRITGFSVNPPHLQWTIATNGGIYQIEYSYDSWLIASNSWVSGPIYTSAVNGTLSVTTGLTLTNNVQYIRVKRLSP